MQKWLGIDFDGTLSKYDGWVSCSHVGDPVSQMVDRIKFFQKKFPDIEVRIFTARWYPMAYVLRDKITQEDILQCEPNSDEHRSFLSAFAIQVFCLDHFGFVVPITCMKDFGMIELWDDRCVQVYPNEGIFVGKSRNFQIR